MRNIFLTLCTLSIYSHALAQEHSILSYINAGISTQNSIYSAYGNKTTVYSANPGIGYTFTPAFAAGFQGSYDQYNTAAGLSTEENITIHDWTAGIFLRYTWHSRSFLFAYAQADLAYAGGNAIEKDLGTQGAYNGMQAAIYPAIGASLKNIAFTFSVGGLGYYYYHWGSNTAGIKDYNTARLTLGREFHFGLLKYFPLKASKTIKEQ